MIKKIFYALLLILASLSVHAQRGSMTVSEYNAKSDFNTALGYYKAGDLEKARIYYTSAANAGLAAAQNNLGSMYYEGEGVEKNDSLAIYWYRRSAEQGVNMAVDNLRKACYQGAKRKWQKGETARAIEWLKIAEAWGREDAKDLLFSIYLETKDYEKAFEYSMRIPDKKEYANVLACGVADIYCQKEDYKKAAEWYKKASDLNNAEASARLGLMYAYGTGVEKDNEKALMLARKVEQSEEPQLQPYVLIIRQLVRQNLVNNAELSDLENAIKFAQNKANPFTGDELSLMLDIIEETRRDSAAHIMKRAQRAYDNKRYAESMDLCQQAIATYSKHDDAEALHLEACYRYIVEANASGTLKMGDFNHYLFESNDPDKKYKTQIYNIYALYLTSHLDAAELDRLSNSVQALPMDNATRKIVDARLKQASKKVAHDEFLEFRGRFANVGVSGEFGGGCGSLDWSVGVGARLGYKCWLLNGYAGLELHGSRYVKDVTGKDGTIPEGGYLNAVHIAIPLALRLNMLHRYTSDLFLSAGVVCNIAMRGRYCVPALEDKMPEWYHNTKILRSCVAPRVGFGYNKDMFEGEMFFTYQPGGLYNDSYLKEKNLQELMDKGAYKQQVANTYSVGLALRVLF